MNKNINSYLWISPDIIHLENMAREFATQFNVADVFWLRDTLTVKDVREFLQKSNLASVGEKKLFIIGDMNNMNHQAQNKMLKTIEDTTDTFLLLASNDNNILNTIKSRCVIKYPDPLPENLTIQKLKENSEGIFAAVRRVINAKSLDEMLPYIATINSNPTVALIYFSELCKDLPITKRHAILTQIAVINRNIAANCNPTNALDTLYMEILKK